MFTVSFIQALLIHVCLYVFLCCIFYAADLEWMFGQVGAIASELEENPRKQIHDVMQSTIRSTTQGGDDDEDDW